MKKALLLIAILAFSGVAQAQTVDLSTPEGKKNAYAILNQQNAQATSVRLEKSLTRIQATTQDQKLKQQIQTILPQLKALEASL